MANWMDAILDRIREAAEAQETASAPDVQDSAPTAPEYSQPENLYAQAAQGYGQPENTPYAPTPYALYGMGDTPLDAAQGRELLYSAQKAREERRAREAARIEEEARQARERQEQARKAQEERLAQASARIEEQARMARELQEQARQTGEERREEARQIAGRRKALEQEPQGVQNALGDVYGAAEQRDDSLQNTPYADILRRRDYTQHAGAGESRLGLGADTDRRYDYINDINGYRARADEQAVMTDDAQRLGKYGLMTDDEIGVYNYLYSTRGREAADRYLDELESELNKQYYSGVKNSTMDEIGDSALDQGLYSGLTVLQQPVRSARSALAVAEDAYRTATGQGIDPYSELRQTSRLTQDIREEIAGNIERAGADAGHETLGKVGSFAYQTAMSALDSAMNAIVAQGIGEGLGIGGDMASKADVERLQKAVNAIGSLTMSSEVASMAVAEAKEKNYSDAGALSLGLVRGGIEYLSEKIGGEWIINKAKGDPTSFWYALKAAMVPEGVEEVMSDAGNELINWFIDPVFGTQESFVANTFRQYKENGADDLAAAGMTAVAVIQQEILSFAGGAFAAIGSGATNYRSNTMAFNDLAARLNTDTRGVVELMREVGAEDVFQLRELAELHDAQSVEQLRERVADTNAVNEAVDAEMSKGGEKENAPAEAEAGERSFADAQDDNLGNAQFENGNAQIENAPAGTAEAEVRAQEGVQINGENAYQGQENGDDGIRAGGEDGGILQESPGGRASVTGGEGQVRQSLGEGNAEDLREVTPAALGITGGDGSRTVQVRGENSYSEQERAAADMVRRAGMTPTIFSGEMLVNGESVNGWIENGQVYVRSDAVDAQGNPIPPESIAWHETFHEAAENDPGLVERGMSIIRENYDEARVQAMKDDYRETYKNIYDFETMTEEEIQKAIETELVGDAGAKLNRFSGDAETRQQIRETMPQVGESQQTQGRERATGPPKGKATMAGQKARTANSTNLQQAERMETEGRSNEEIRQETGWFRGMDGQWRFEIDDSGAKYYRSGDARFRNDHPEYARYQDLMGKFLNGDLTADELLELQGLEQTWGREQQRLKEMVDSGRATLDMLLDHPALFEAYPELKQARVRFADLNPGTNGQYDRKHNNFTLSNELRNAPESTLIHEIQHAVQAVEGFSGGASVEYWENQERSGKTERWKSDETKELEQKREELLESMTEEGRAVLSELNRVLYSEEVDFDRAGELEDELWDGPDADKYGELLRLEGKLAISKDNDRRTSAQFNYLNTAGEIEARDTANRRTMTAEEREKTSPDLGDENTVFAERSAVSFEHRANLKDLDIPWDPDNTSTIKEQVIRKLDYLNTKKPVTEVTYDKTAGKSYYEQLDEILRTRFGYKIDRQGFGSFLFDEKAIGTLRHYVGSDAEAAAAIASPYVLKRGEIISGHRNHNNGQYPSVTFAAPVVLNGETGIEAVTVLFADKDRVHSLRVLTPGGDEFVLMPIKNETGLEMAGVNAKAEITQPTSTVSNGSILQSDGKSNPKNGGHASMNVPAERTAAEIRKEIRQAENEYSEHADAGDEEYDYRAQLEKIKALREEAEEAEAGEKETGEQKPEAAQENTEKAENTAAETSGEPESRETAEEAKKDLLEVGEGRVKNDTGDYTMKLRLKRNGMYLASVEINGRRDAASTFHSAQEAAEWAEGYVKGQTRAREDAALDRHKSKKERAPTITEALFGQTDPKKEADRRLRNSAADAETQTLRGRIRRANDEIQALNRVEKTAGLTEQQKAHREDLRKTLEIMNDELDRRKARNAEERKAQAERRKAERVEVTGNKPTQSTADARREIMNLFHTPEGVRNEVGAAVEQRLKEMLETGRVTEESRQALFDTLVDAGVVPKQADPTFRQIRDDLSGRRIFVSEKERADFGDNWKSVYQKAWGARIFLTSDPTDTKLDAVNSELAEVYGEKMFPTDAALSDMLDNMLDKAERGKTTQQSLADAVSDEARYTGASEDQIYQEMFGRLNEQLRTFAKKAGLEVMLKNKAASDAATERKRWEDRQERKAQERRESKIRERVQHGLQRLEKLRGKAAPEVRAQVDEVLKDIDTQARGLTPYGIENLKALQEAYEEKARQEGFIDDENPGNFIRNPYVEEQLKRLSAKHLNEMDIADVIELGRAVSGLENTIRTANQMIGDEFDATVKETAEGVDREVKASKGAKAGFLQKWFREEQLSPRRFLDMLGGWKDGTMKKLSASLENGQTRMLDFQRRAQQSFDPFMSKEENRKWLETASGKKATWSSYGVVNGMAMDGSGFTGQSIEITPMMKIALYLHSLNDDNLRHIQTGGIVVPNKALYQKGKISEAYAQGQRVKMQPEAVRAIASSLTQQEKTFAGYLQKFFNEQSKAAINEVSMQLDGFVRASVDRYFPIETDASFNRSDVAGEARAQTVEGIGSIANERVHAGNPIRLCDASDVLMRQIDKVSRYYGYAIPIRNFQAVNNYVFHEEGNAFAGSIKDSMNKKWGSGAQQYITKMLADLQSGGSSKSDAMSRALSGLRSNLAGATLTLNPSVAISQAASYPGAAQVVGWDGLAAGLRGKVDEKLIEKYTPLLWYRSQGYSTQELGDAKSAANQNMAQKALTNKWLNWIQGMDRATVKRLWAAAEYRVKKDTGMKPGSKAQIDAGTDPYYKAVAEVFNRAVYDTQPNYTNMERAQILRSESDLTKFLTMYKTVPLQYYGMMTEAAGRLRAAMAGGTEQEKAAARKYAADTFGGLLAANTVYAAIKALFKGFRRKDDAYRDEEGELTAESVTKQLGKDLAEVYAGSVIGGAEAYSAAQYLFKGGRYNAPELNIMSYGEDFIKGLRSVYSALDDEDPRKTAKAIKDAALTISQGMGLPVKNVETYFMAGVRWLRPDVALGYDNAFGGIDKSDLNGMDPETVGMATNIIMRDRTGETLDRSTTDELARLYGAGHKEAVPTAIPESFEYGGNTVKITDRAAYRETWGGVVGDNLEELLSSEEYKSADDKGKKAMISKLYQYATVQARMGADPEYSPEGNSTYGWTLKADEAQRAGIDLPAAIGALNTFANMTTERDATGADTATKKSKVLSYIDGLDMDDEQKDLLYEMAGYTSGLEMAPWHSGIDAGVAGGTGPKADAATKKSIVDQYTEALTGSAAYQAADDNGRKAMLQRLQEYATVQGMKKTDPGYSPSGSGYGWTVWADQAVKAGIELPDAIAHMTAMSGMRADYDKYGKAITGSKKDKVCAYIDALDLTSEQKDALYLYVYKENSLKYTPWHGYKGKSRRGGSGGRRGRGGGKRTSTRTTAGTVTAAATRSSGGIDVSKLFGGSTKAGNYDADASRKLLEIIDKYYGGDAWAAAMDGGRAAKGKTQVDFKL